MNAIGKMIGGFKNLLGSGESGWAGETPAGFPNFGGFSSSAGKTITPTNSMTVSAVWACVSRTAQLISSLPLHIFEADSDGSKTIVENDLSKILTLSPNLEQTAVEFWEGMIGAMILQGNAYAKKIKVGARLVGLSPLFGVFPERDQSGILQYYQYVKGRKIHLVANDIFHLRGFGDGSGLGMSAIKFGSNSLGLALGAEETAGKLFANAMMASGLLTSDQVLTADQRKSLKELMENFVGSEKSGKILTLEAGLKYAPMQMNPEDAQLLDSRKFNVEDVCRWFGVPPIIIGHASAGQTMWGSGVEAIMLGWLTTGIHPLLVKIEARIKKDLIGNGSPRQTAGFDREAMLQMDSKAMAEYLSKMTTTGLMSRNEGREKLGLKKRVGADDLTAQMALAPIETLGASNE